MAARRERERRRPNERRYQFAPPGTEPSVEPEEPFGDGAPLAEDEVADVDAEVTPSPAATTRTSAVVRTRPARGAVTRAEPRPFTEYREDYRYVVTDLRRILVVVGSLLVVLILLWLVLPR
jgi:hypothetical protein